MMNSFNIIQRYSLVHCSESLIEHKFHSVISFLMLTSAIICSFPYFHGLRKCKKYFDLYRVFCVCESALMFVRVEESCSIVSSVYNWTLIIIIPESPVINTVLNLLSASSRMQTKRIIQMCHIKPVLKFPLDMLYK